MCHCVPLHSSRSITCITHGCSSVSRATTPKSTQPVTAYAFVDTQQVLPNQLTRVLCFRWQHADTAAGVTVFRCGTPPTLSADHATLDLLKSEAATAGTRPVPDSVCSGLEAVHLRVPSSVPYTPFLCQRPEPAVGVHTPKPEGRPLPTDYFGFKPVRQSSRAKRQLDQLHDGPSTYFTAPPAERIFPWERSASDVFGSFTSTLNLDLLKKWASTYLTGPAREYALACYSTGFSSRSEAPQLLDISAANAVHPDTPAGAAVDEQLARFAARGRLLSTDLPIVAGTQVIPLSHASQVKVNRDLTSKVKKRAVVRGSYPNPKDPTSRRAWINPGELAFTIACTIIEICAYSLRFDVVAASCFDYASFFETIPRVVDEIAASALFWRGKFHYLLDHVFGECATPHSAQTHAAVLQAAHSKTGLTVLP